MSSVDTAPSEPTVPDGIEDDLEDDQDENASNDNDQEEIVETNIEMNSPPACDIPNGSRCMGDVYEECQGDALVQINCADQEERCISDNNGRVAKPYHK